MNNLILPVAGLSSRYPNMRPKWLLTMPDGKLMIEKSITGLEINKFNKVYVVVLKEHLTKYVDKKKIIKSLKENISKRIKIVVLNKPTTCQAETVYRAIKIENIRGPIFVKDCDNMFSLKINKSLANEVAILNLNKTELIEAKSKSYVTFDKLNKITNIIEKKVISNFFCCGGYSFGSAGDYVKYSKKLLAKSSDVYISHVVFSMILDNKIFRVNEVSNYTDWGTLREFRNWQKKHLTIFCDFDGCLVINGSKFGVDGYNTNPISQNLLKISELTKTGFVEIIIVTSRPKSEKHRIKKILNKFNIKPKYIITDLFHTRRAIINDFANTNPFPSAISINLERDSNKLSNILQNLIF